MNLAYHEREGKPRDRPMKVLALPIGIVVMMSTLSVSAQGQTNRWCAYFTNGPTNCGFTTFQKCLEAIRGKTGLCDQNSQYALPRPPPHPSPSRRQTGSDPNNNR
jgi:Protein of unknown function (DUF3551)